MTRLVYPHKQRDRVPSSAWKKEPEGNWTPTTIIVWNKRI